MIHCMDIFLPALFLPYRFRCCVFTFCPLPPASVKPYKKRVDQNSLYPALLVL
jgi:hypothetical protein